MVNASVHLLAQMAMPVSRLLASQCLWTCSQATPRFYLAAVEKNCSLATWYLQSLQLRTKCLSKTLLSTGHILHRHIAIIMKPSPPFPISDVVMVQGLLLIFLHSCEIKSGSGLGTRLVAGIP